MVVDVILERAPHACHHSLDGHNVCPGAFALPEIGIEEIPTMIINGGNQIPFGRRLWGPEMIGRIVLHQLPHIIGEDFPIMSLAEGAF